MTISHIGTGQSGAFGFTAQAGDIIMLGQWYISAATAPSAAPDYTTLDSGVQGTAGYRFGWKIAVGTETGPYAATPSNTQHIVWAVFRSSSGVIQVGASALAKGTGTTATIPALTLQITDGSSWVQVPVFSRTSTQAQMAGAVTGTTMRFSNTRNAGHDTNGGVSSWASKTKAGMASESWVAMSIELTEGPPPVNLTATQNALAATQATAIVVPPFARALTASQTLSAVTQIEAVAVVVNSLVSQATQKVTQASSIAMGGAVGSANISGLQTTGKAIDIATIYVPVNSATARTLAPMTQSTAINVPSYVANVSANQIMPAVQNAWNLTIPNGARRIMLGSLPSGAKGLRISQGGYDAGSHPVDDAKLIFSSEWPEVMQIHQVGSFSHRTTAQQGQTTSVVQTANHTLGYIPFVDFIIRGNGNALPAGTDFYPSNRYYDRGGMTNGLRYFEAMGVDGASFLRCNVSSTQIRVESAVRQSGSDDGSFGLARTWTIYYIIYRKAVP